MPSFSYEVDQRPHFRIRRPRAALNDANRDLRKLRLKALDKWQRIIVGISNAEQDFEVRIRNQGMAANRGIEVIVCSVDRFEDGDGRSRRTQAISASQMKQTGNERQDLIGRDTQQREKDHTANRATPKATSKAPAHLRPSTCSRRKYFASIVSITKLAAVAGTAKLKSATERRTIKAKNEIAMQTTLRIILGRPRMETVVPTVASACRFISRL